MTIESYNLQAYCCFIHEALFDHVEENKAYYYENPNRLEDLQEAVNIVSAAAAIMPELLEALKLARRNGDNCLTPDTKSTLEEPISNAQKCIPSKVDFTDQLELLALEENWSGEEEMLAEGRRQQRAEFQYQTQQVSHELLEAIYEAQAADIGEPE